MSDENVEREADDAFYKRWCSMAHLPTESQSDARRQFRAGYIARASRQREAKCPACGGVGEHVEGKRGFTRFPCPNAAPPVAPEAFPSESATAEGGGGDTKRAADGGTPAALSHPGLLGQSRLGSSDHTTEPLWVERDGKRVWSEGWQANRGVPYTPGMLDTLRFYAKDHFDRVQAYNDDPKRVGPEKCPESVWVMADRLLAAFPATPASAAGREGAHGPGKCLSVDAIEFDRTVASREQDERERWIREDERAKCLHAAKHSPACKGCKRVMANAIRALLASPVEGAREKFYEAARVEMDAAAAWEVESGKCSGERSAALCRALEHAHFNARSMAATCYRALLAAEAAGGGE